MAKWTGKSIPVNEKSNNNDDPTDAEIKEAADNWAHMDPRLKTTILQLEMQARKDAKDAGVKPRGK